MFVATIPPGDIQSAFEPVHALVDECKVHISEDGLRVRAVDPANVGMVDMELPESMFETYESNAHTIGVSLQRFLDIISLFGQTDDVAHLMLDEETHQLRMESGGLDYTLSLIDPDSIRKEPKLPDLDLTVEARLNGSQFNRAVTACDMVADHIELGGTVDGEVFAKAEGDTDSVDLVLDSDELAYIDAGEASSLFNLEYLKDMEKVIADNVEVTLQLGVEFPLLLSYNLSDSDGTVQYMLAPRIQSD